MFQRAFLRFEAGESGKQCGVHIHDSIKIVVDEMWAEDSKVACKSDETVFGSNTASFQSGDSLPVVLRVHLWQVLIVKDNRRHVVFPGYLKRSDAGFVTDDNTHPTLRDVLSINGIQDRFQIRATSRNQDTNRNQDYLPVPVRLFLRYAVFWRRELNAMSKAMIRIDANPRNFLASLLSITRSFLTPIPLYVLMADLITGFQRDWRPFKAHLAAPNFDATIRPLLKSWMSLQRLRTDHQGSLSMIFLA